MDMATVLLHDLPDDIVIWEILLRLPPKSVLRCRAVSHAWRHATSTGRFLGAHHAYQPNLPLLRQRDITASLGIITFDHRVAAGLRSVARLDFRHPAQPQLVASCDGLLLLLVNDTSLCICNPTTRQYAPLPLHREFRVKGMYLHVPTGEYRLLLNLDPAVMHDVDLPLTGARQYGCHVFTIGSREPPRHVGYVKKLVSAGISIVFRGRLHWYLGDHMVTVFDTITESFLQMGSPVVPANAVLFETGGMIGMLSKNFGARAVDIWVMHDYECEVWATKHRVRLPVAEIMAARLGMFDYRFSVQAASWDGRAFLLLSFGGWLHQVDVNGKPVTTLHRSGLRSTNLWLKQTLVSHAFFPALEGYVVNAFPFI